MWLSDLQKIGVGLTGFGMFFMILGILLLFDGGFLAIGNVFVSSQDIVSIWNSFDHRNAKDITIFYA
jgi:hypothetical protein